MHPGAAETHCPGREERVTLQGGSSAPRFPPERAGDPWVTPVISHSLTGCQDRAGFAWGPEVGVGTLRRPQGRAEDVGVPLRRARREGQGWKPSRPRHWGIHSKTSIQGCFLGRDIVPSPYWVSDGHSVTLCAPHPVLAVLFSVPAVPGAPALRACRDLRAGGVSKLTREEGGILTGVPVST